MNSQFQFRQGISTRDHSCLISKLDASECDAGHIIPYTICEKYAPQFIYDRRNGLFMCKNFHTLFDKFYWTFDIYDLRYDQMTGKYSMKLIVIPTHKNLSINQYKDLYVYIPIEIFPFLYTHYQLFISYHYEKKSLRLTHETTTGNGSLGIEQFYREMINDDTVFKYLLLNELPIDALLHKIFKQFMVEKGLLNTGSHPTSMVIVGGADGLGADNFSASDTDNVYYVNTLIKHRLQSNQTYYLVWWDMIPLSDATWEPEQNIKSDSLIEYHDRLEKMTDSDYPSSYHMR